MKKLFKALAAVSLLALAFNFTSCKEEEDEDDSINGADILVVNTDGSTTKRAYSSTRLKHLGTLARLELKEQTNTSKDGVAGIIWDLKKSSKAKEDVVADDDAGTLAEGSETLTDAINFFIIGFLNYDGKLGYYISKFYNITSVNNQNFGAWNTSANKADTVVNDEDGLAATTPKELVVVDGSKTGEIQVNGVGKSLGAVTVVKEKDTDTTGTVYVWVDIYPAATKYGIKKADHATEADVGKFVVDIYLGKDEPTIASTPAETVVIERNQTGYETEIKQAKAARYGSAYGGKTLKAYVDYEDTYAAAEVVEE